MSQYAAQSDLENLGLPAAALTSPVTPAIITEHIKTASAILDSYARGRYSVPLQLPYPPEVVHAVAAVAAYTLLTWRGHNPDDYDEQFEKRHDRAIAWMKDLSAGRVSLAITADLTPGVHEGASAVSTGSLRGWGDDINGIGEPRGFFWGSGKED